MTYNGHPTYARLKSMGYSDYRERERERKRLISRADYQRKKYKDDVWNLTGGACFYCGRITSRNAGPYSPELFTIDHIIPIVEGGVTDLTNLVPCCRKCNVTRGAHDLDYLKRILANGDPSFQFYFERYNG